MFEVQKEFLTGPLRGLVITEQTSVRFQPQKVYTSFNGTRYIVLSVKQC